MFMGGYSHCEENDIWLVNLVYGETDIRNSSVLYWIPGQILIRPFLQNKYSVVEIAPGGSFGESARALKLHSFPSKPIIFRSCHLP